MIYIRTDQDNPSIGILLCKNKRGMIAEYALRDIEKPIGVSEYKLFEKLPQKYNKLLSSVADIEKHIGRRQGIKITKGFFTVDCQ
jgi:hypothetical protein